MACVHPELSGVLREELTCPVCLDVYRDPRLLPCGHNFCLGCLRRLQRQASSQRAPILCPECRQSHRCSALAFQKNFKLANIADDYRRRGRAAAAATTVSSTSGEAVPGSSSSPLGALSLPCLSVPCDYCPLPGAGPSPSPGNTESAAAAVVNGGGGGASVPGEAAMVAVVATPTPAVKTCLKCEVSMCGEHVRPHLELPAFREHPLSDPLGDLGSRKCPSHDEIYRYYCLDDHVCVCNACTIEGGHAGHTIKTLRNTGRDMKDSLDRQLYRVERRFTSTEKKVHEQREKERQNRKFLEDAAQCLATLGEELKAKVDVFVAGLRGSAQDHADANRRVIQKNLQRVGQDQARLQAAYKTAKKQHHRQLRKSMFYPEYVDMETDSLRDAMSNDMARFLEVQLQSLIMDALDQLRHLPEAGGEDGDQEGIEEEDVTEEEEEDDNDDEEDEDSSEEMRSEGEEEEEEEEEAGEEEDHSDSADSLYSPEEEGYEEEDGEEEEEEEEEEV
ncbi:hypothetical protein CRUP_006033 [Coryphaenoides rupestris]|nr:hypothetical protein CRUP_006033 [Coryphaenoides rupestris]